MNVIPTSLPGVVVIEPKVFGDARGFFVETWRATRYAEAEVPPLVAQDNLARSAQGVLRGLHFQHPQPQGKLVYVLEGEVLDVAVDVRRGSPTFGRAVTATLSAENFRQLFVPEGFAHGYYVVSPTALVAYKCTSPYAPECERGIAWNDPQIAVTWPTSTPLLSAKDAQLPRLAELPPERLPTYSSSRSGVSPL